MSAPNARGQKIHEDTDSTNFGAYPGGRNAGGEDGSRQTGSKAGGISKLGGKVTGNLVSKLVDKVDNIIGKVAKLGWDGWQAFYGML